LDAKAISRVFIGPFGLRAGWRLTLFILILGVLGTALGLAGRIPALRLGGIAWPIVLAVLGATAVMARIDRRPFTSYGLGAVNRWRNLLAGTAAGFLGLSLLMGFLVATGAFHPTGADSHGIDIVRWGLFWTLLFACTSLSEELTTRGYALFALAQGIGFWPAAVAFSLLFGAGHLGNRGEENIGIANAVLAGLVFAYSLRWTGTLWWALGCHLSWDWAETFFYGVPNSGGGIAPHHLFSGRPDGPYWLSGGTVGPEGSVLAALILLLLAAAVRFTTPRYHAPGMDRLKAAANAEAG